ncbi:MAG: insulinase family protein [Ignavibacteria bacterium]|nr:insulinase family protein [Ignavibacteria bacterium]
MDRYKSYLFLFLFLVAGSVSAQLKVDYEYYKLDNGLKVVLSQNKTAPVVTVAVYYNIGFRIEPRDRTGFAHLFEHMMFQGSKNLGKMEFIKLVQSNGGILNGSTRFDFTNYFAIVPSHKLETILWAEADRMSGLDITQENLVNQQGVVTNEVKVNVLNQPYGGFPWLDLPQAANENWYNAHNFYGDLKDLDAATLADVKDFFSKYYIPNNAALVITGDFEKPEAKEFVKKYFGKIPAGKQQKLPDISEPRQEKERISVKVDSLANKPAIAFGYKMPAVGTPEYFAMGIIDQVLLQGQDSRLYQKLISEKGYYSGVYGGINSGLGNMFNYNGPMLWDFYLLHESNVTPEEIIASVDEVVKGVIEKPLAKDEISRALVKMRSNLYDVVEGTFGFGLADLLACYALFNDDPGKINTIEDSFKKVTPELIQKTAKEYLRSSNRTIIKLDAKAAK